MEVHTVLLHLLIILLCARIFAELAVRLQIPSVIGELFAGVLLGPSLLGWVSPSDAIKLLAEIGIILLLFEIGLDTDLRRLMRTGFKSFIAAIISTLFCMARTYDRRAGTSRWLCSRTRAFPSLLSPLRHRTAQQQKNSRSIEQEMKPIIHLFTPIFFVMVALCFALHEIDWGSPFVWLFSLSMFLAAVVGKLIGAIALKVPLQMKWMIGTAMIPRGEVG